MFKLVTVTTFFEIFQRLRNERQFHFVLHKATRINEWFLISMSVHE